MKEHKAISGMTNQYEEIGKRIDAWINDGWFPTSVALSQNNFATVYVAILEREKRPL